MMKRTRKAGNKGAVSHDTFSGNMKLAELVDANYMLLPVVERLGIALGFGDVSVDEACRKVGVPADFLLLICNIYTFDDYMPDGGQLDTIDPVQLISYLHNSHEYYSRRQIPRLGDKLSELVSSCHASNSQLLSRFFDNYRREVANHFRYEDEVVFPYVREVVAGKRSQSGYSIERFEENHDSIDEKLDDLKNIIMKYLPGVGNEVLRTEVLFDLYQLGEDIGKHTIIEDRILIPLVARLEKNMA